MTLKVAYQILFGMWGLWSAGAACADPPASVANYNYVVGTQTIGPTYRFTKQTALVETAQATLDLGSDILKIKLSRNYGEGGYPGVVPKPTIRRFLHGYSVLHQSHKNREPWLYTASSSTLWNSDIYLRTNR